MIILIPLVVIWKFLFFFKNIISNYLSYVFAQKIQVNYLSICFC